VRNRVIAISCIEVSKKAHEPRSWDFAWYIAMSASRSTSSARS
jgi:hypothetical protein